MQENIITAPSRAALGCVLLTAVPLAHAAGDPPVIVVTPTRMEIPLVRSPVPVEVISRQEIENSLTNDVAEIIEQYSGLEIARNGGYGSVTSLFTRGSESNHTVVLIDGVKINPATIGGPALQNISPSIIDRIEIIKGPRSSVYGSEAIGGVVNIITRKKVYGTEGSITMGIAEYDTTTYALDGAYGNGEISTGITFEQFDTGGFTVTDDSEEDHGYDNQTANAYVNFQTDRHQLNLRHWQATGNVEYFYFGEQNQDFENSATAAHWNSVISDQFNSSIRVSQINDDIQQNEENFLSELDYAVTVRDEIDVKFDYSVTQDSVFSAGVLRAVEDVDALSFGTLIEEETDIDETYALYHAWPGRHNYALSIRQTDHEDFGSYDTWNLDYRFQLDTGISVYLGLGTGFRAPDHTDRFGFGGNPDLDPETSDNLELGLVLDMNADSRFQVSVFQTRIEDLIEFSGSQVINVDEAQIEGIEISFNHQLERWNYQLNALLQDPQNKTQDEMLSRRAESTVNAMVNYQQANWQLGVKASVVSERDNSSFDSITLPAYELVDIAGYYQLSAAARLSARVDNVFNEQYETAAGFNTADRTLKIELSYRFAR